MVFGVSGTEFKNIKDLKGEEKKEAMKWAIFRRRRRTSLIFK